MTQWHRDLSEIRCPLDSRKPYIPKPRLKKEPMSEEEKRRRNAESHRRCYNPLKESMRKKKYYQKIKCLLRERENA